MSAVANYDPAFVAVLRRALEGWTSSNVKGPASLVWMTPFCRKGHSGSLRSMLLMLPPAKLKTIALKFDKHNAALSGSTPHELAMHIVSLASEEMEPAAKPSKPAKPGKAKANGIAKMRFADILRLTDREKLRAELNNLSVGALRKGMDEAGMEAEPKAKKAQLIHAIQAELAAGWPRPRSVLDTSRY
ncbi:MAG: hypothetical protein HC850_02040 [Rhodomicrobium sp.]|nr:hypothetical protein [Rhodomicrobium sp.]